ncbi:MAG: methionyl-tRNA formyltransferase [Gammaproteobacteria bacterium]|nr:methionyl-tRNA formyltransferase [Gammaproteobacteria bacterium]
MTSKSLRLAFAGTPELAATVLARLLADTDHAITKVLTQPDRPAGRGRKPRISPVKSLATEAGLPLSQPATVSELEAISLDDVDAMIVAAYGMILPTTVLEAPVHGCINIHTSLLPRWRGAAPIQRAIQHGDRETGVSIMLMDAGLDTGPVILQKTCAIASRETAGTLHDKLARLGSGAIIEALNQLAEGSATFEIQDESRATYAKKISKQEALLDWHLSAVDLERTIRAFNPAPVAHTVINGQDFRVWEADCKDRDCNDVPPGTIINCSRDGIEVACNPGILLLRKIQLPGKKPMPVSQVLNGRPAFLQS